uniref:Small ribosomal subunit protein eS21 n=1 Tax=Periophthalmus magnuspinnatus TaxID=409849 RepID=A0A3B4B512_9GOBI
MQNDAGEFVDLYVPRKCSASNRIIAANDHASVQINIAEVEKSTGRFNGQFKTYAICGAIRRMVRAFPLYNYMVRLVCVIEAESLTIFEMNLQIRAAYH